MKKIMLALIGAAFAQLKPEHIRAGLRIAMNAIEKRVLATANETDDALLLPLVNNVRKAIDG
jgi:hypothetical protein